MRPKSRRSIAHRRCIGNIETSIDSLHAAPFLFWAGRAAGDEKMREVARAHAATIIPLHRRADNSFIQSSTLDATGRLVKHYTHKGYSATGAGAARRPGASCFPS